MSDDNEIKKISVVELINQFTESTQSIFELTSRMDERIKIIMEQQSSAEKKFTQFIELQHEMISRVIVLESKNGHKIEKEMEKIERQIEKIEEKMKNIENDTQVLKMHSQSNMTIWKQIGDFVVKIIWVVVACWLVLKLGLSNLPLP